MNPTCVVIEDHIEHNEVLKALAKIAGFEVEAHFSAETFLEKNVFNHACFLVDINLPGRSGVQLIPEIRKHNKLAKILIISANKEDEDIREGLKVGADDFIAKPYKSEHLSLKLSNAFEKYKSIVAVNFDQGVKFIEEADVLSIDGKVFHLTDGEFKIAKALYAKGMAMGIEEIETLLLSTHTRGSIEVALSTLRKKIQGTQVHIKNLRGIGYLWVSKK